MEPYEKEQMLYNEIHSMIESVVRENDLTYCQILGVLEGIKNDYMMEWKFTCEGEF